MERYLGYSLAVAGFLSVFVEVSKIKLNPWSSLIRYIGKALTQDLQIHLNDLEKGLKENSGAIEKIGKELERCEHSHKEELIKVSNKVDKNEIKRIRAEILSFANSCKIGSRFPTKDEFEHIIEIHDDYEELLDNLGLKNGIITIEFEFIRDLYLKHPYPIQQNSRSKECGNVCQNSRV